MNTDNSQEKQCPMGWGKKILESNTVLRWNCAIVLKWKLRTTLFFQLYEKCPLYSNYIIEETLL